MDSHATRSADFVCGQSCLQRSPLRPLPLDERRARESRRRTRYAYRQSGRRRARGCTAAASAPSRERSKTQTAASKSRRSALVGGWRWKRSRASSRV